jgi:hypothetical protein
LYVYHTHMTFLPHVSVSAQSAHFKITTQLMFSYILFIIPVLRESQWHLMGWLQSYLLLPYKLVFSTNHWASALLTAGIFIGLHFKPGDGNDMFLWNIS